MISGLHQAQRASRDRWGLFVILVVIVAAAPASANLGGYIDLSGNRTDIDGLRRESFRQEYDLQFNHVLTPYVRFRASARYYKFDQDVDLALSVFQEEFQPQLELIWRHPVFNFTTSAYRRRAKASALTGNITTDSFLAAFKTNDERYPLLGLRYDWQHVFDNISGFEREVHDERLQFTAEYLRTTNDLYYTFNNRINENVVSNVESTRRDHRFRWRHAQNRLADGNLDLNFNYNFSYGEQYDRLLAGDSILERIPIRVGLYALDNSPDLGTLDPVPGLSDGNLTAPTIPPIDIGGATIGRNIGADLSFERPVTALYLYTDRLSGIQPTWRFFVSTDNLNWTPWTLSAPVEFNAALSRYEFAFPQVTTRFVKVVKDGINEILDVLVTEVEVLQLIENVNEQARIGRAHYADGRVGYRLTERLKASVDGSLGYDSGGGPTGDRSNIDYTARGVWDMSGAFTHQLQWSQSFTDLEVGDDQRSDIATYTLLYEPRETISSSMGASARRSFFEGLKDADNRNAFIDISGRLVPRLNLSVGGSLSRLENYLTRLTNDVGTLRGSLDGTVAPWLDLGFGYTYQDYSGEPNVERRIRRTADLSFNWRLSRTIFARGRITRIVDVVSTLRQDYLLSWNMLPRLSVTGQVFFNREDQGRRSERFTGNATYELGSNSMIYFRWNQHDLTQAGGNFTETLQLGFRLGF